MQLRQKFMNLIYELVKMSHSFNKLVLQLISISKKHLMKLTYNNSKFLIKLNDSYAYKS